MPSSSLVILNHILPSDAVDLGRLVVSVTDPLQNFYQSKSLAREISIQHLEKYSDVLSKVEGSGLHGALTAFFSANFAIERESETCIESPICITRQLHNADDYFAKLCRLAPAKAWMERSLRRNQAVFLVAGIKTLSDATVTQTEVRRRETSFDVQAPMSAAITCATGVPLSILGGVVDPGGGVDIQRKLTSMNSFFAPGEHIYAVQYRKVKLSLFARRNYDKAWLESGNRWKAYAGSRGGAEADQENDGIEASLGEMEVDDVHGGENCETLEVDGQQMIYFGGVGKD